MNNMPGLRFQVVPDPQNEQFKIIDSHTVVGTEDQDRVWFCTAYDYADACLLSHLLNTYKPVGSSTDQSPCA